MKAHVHLLVFTVLSLALSCSTGPEFKRDNFRDAGSTYPTAKFLSPQTGNSRSSIDYSSYTIIVNAAAKKLQSEIVLSSNIDGNFLQVKVAAQDTIYIDRTELSLGSHEVSLLTDGEPTDRLNQIVDLPNEVEMKSIKFSNGSYIINWEKYEGENFKSYKVYSVPENSNPVLLAIINNRDNTSFTDTFYPFTTQFNYILEIYDSDFPKHATIFTQVVTPRIWKSSYWWLTSQFTKHFETSNNSDDIYIAQNDSLFKYDLDNNLQEFINIHLQDYIDFFINDFKSPPELIVTRINSIDRYNLNTNELISNRSSDYIYKLFYDPDVDKFFGEGYYNSYTTKYLLIGFKFNQNKFQYLKTYNLDCDASAPRINIISKEVYTANKEDELCIYSYTENSSNLILKEKKNVGSLKVENILFHNIVSKDGKYYLGSINKKPTVFNTTDFSIVYVIDLESSYDTYITATHFLESNSNILLIGTKSGKFIIYDVSSKTKIKEFQYNFRISKIFEKSGELYLLIEKVDRLKGSQFIIRKAQSF